MSIDQQELKERCDHLGKRVVAIEGRLAAVKAELKTECALWIGALQEELSEAKCACENRFDALVRRAYALDDLYDALEARCHELEHDGAKGVQEQIADLQERVRVLENEHSGDAPSEVRAVQDHRDTARPVKPPMMACPGDGEPSCNACKMHQPHSFSAGCCNYACVKMTGLFLCQPVPASPVAAIPDVPAARIGEHEAAEEKVKEIEW